jgi:hypothetical protein
MEAMTNLRTIFVGLLLLSLTHDSSSFHHHHHHHRSVSPFLKRRTTPWLHSVPPRRVYEGRPSFPGWKTRQLDTLTDWAKNDEANRSVICEYEPDAWWLWTKWRGTVLSITILPILFNVGVGIAVDMAVHAHSASSWPLFAKPPADDPILQQLQGLNKLWEYQVTLCTFILTFFTAEAYNHWRSVYFTTRAIQGRINDVCMLVTISAYQHPDAQELVARVTRLIRLSHTLFWAATPTCSNGVGDGGVKDGDQNEELPPKEWKEDAIGVLLLSHDGLLGLVQAGELTSEEANALMTCGLPPNQYTYVLLEWVGLYIMDGLESGLLGHYGNDDNNSGLEENLLRQLTAVRAEYFSIGDYSAGRMPLAYVQLVQVLVDSLVYLAPFALYSELGTLSVVLTGLLTFFFKGLLELSKSFLDPFGNEGFPGQNIRVDVLVSELNFGAASRWVKAAESCPKPPTSIASSNSTKPLM